MRAGQREEEGQIALPLLLVVVVMLFFGLVYFQVGSAADQKVLAQTAGDSAVVAATHVVRDDRIVVTAKTMTWSFAALFAGIPRPADSPSTRACNAAVRNWASGPHQGRSIGCGDVTVSLRLDGAQVDLISPPGVVKNRPVDTSGQEVRARAVARVAADGCPRARIVASPAATALADWLADATLASMGGSPVPCTTPAELTLLRALDLAPGSSATAIGDPRVVLNAVRRSTRVEIVD